MIPFKVKKATQRGTVVELTFTRVKQAQEFRERADRHGEVSA